MELHRSIFGHSGRFPKPTSNARAVSHITFGLVARVFGAVEQVKEANDARLKELKHPVVNREKAAAYLLYDLVRMEFPAMPLPAVKAGKRLREQLNATERAIKSATDACAAAVKQAAPMDAAGLKSKLQADIADILRAKCTALDEPPLPPPRALMPPRQAPPASPLTRVPALDDPRSPSVPAHLATIYKELAETREEACSTMCGVCSAGVPSAAPYLWKLAKQIDKRERLSELECENETLKCQNENLKKELAAAKHQLEVSRLEEAGEYERAEAFDVMAEARLAEAGRLLQAAQAAHVHVSAAAAQAMPALLLAKGPALLAECPAAEPLAEDEGMGLESMPEEAIIHRHVLGLVRSTRHALSSLAEVTAEETAFKAGCYNSLQSFDTVLHAYLCLPSHARAQWQYLQPNRPAYRVFVDREAGMRQVFGLHR